MNQGTPSGPFFREAAFRSPAPQTSMDAVFHIRRAAVNRWRTIGFSRKPGHTTAAWPRPARRDSRTHAAADAFLLDWRESSTVVDVSSVPSAPTLDRAVPGHLDTRPITAHFAARRGRSRMGARVAGATAGHGAERPAPICLTGLRRRYRRVRNNVSAAQPRVGENEIPAEPRLSIILAMGPGIGNTEIFTHTVEPHVNAVTDTPPTAGPLSWAYSKRKAKTERSQVSASGRIHSQTHPRADLDTDEPLTSDYCASRGRRLTASGGRARLRVRASTVRERKHP